MKIIVCSLERSGSHAIINWMMHQWRESAIFFNNIIYLRSGRRGSAQIRTKGNPPFHHRIYSFENLPPEECFLPVHEIHGTEVSPDLNVLILRDPFNWLASITKADISLGGDASWFQGLGISSPSQANFSRVCLYKQFCSYARTMPQSHLLISFNRWFLEADYRSKLAQIHLKGIFTDNGLNNVPDFGPWGGPPENRGSSFSRRLLDGRAQEMPVLERWKEMRGEALYQEAIRRFPELGDLSEEFFNFNPYSQIISAVSH